MPPNQVPNGPGTLPIVTSVTCSTSRKSDHFQRQRSTSSGMPELITALWEHPSEFALMRWRSGSPSDGGGLWPEPMTLQEVRAEWPGSSLWVRDSSVAHNHGRTRSSRSGIQVALAAPMMTKSWSVVTAAVLGSFCITAAPIAAAPIMVSVDPPLLNQTLRPNVVSDFDFFFPDWIGMVLNGQPISVDIAFANHVAAEVSPVLSPDGITFVPVTVVGL